MATKKSIELVLKVSITLPNGANVKDGQDFVREAVKYACQVTDNPKMQGVKADNVTVALVSSTVHQQY